MKKFLLILTVLLLLAGTVFYFGWIQFRLERGVFGVIYTKTHGYAEKPVVSGRFSWSFWALIPGNMEIVSVPSTDRSVKLTTENSLPQAELYQRVLTGNPKFSYSIQLQITYSISEHFAVTAVRERGLTEQGIDSWFMELDNSIKQTAQMYLEDFLLQDAMYDNLQALPDEAEAYISSQLSGYYPELTISKVSAVFSSLPDFSLYNQAVQQYKQLLENKHKAILKAMESDPQSYADNLLYLDQLESYGELLSRYPILLEYIQLDNPHP